LQILVASREQDVKTRTNTAHGHTCVPLHMRLVTRR